MSFEPTQLHIIGYQLSQQIALRCNLLSQKAAYKIFLEDPIVAGTKSLLAKRQGAPPTSPEYARVVAPGELLDKLSKDLAQNEIQIDTLLSAYANEKAQLRVRGLLQGEPDGSTSSDSPESCTDTPE
jgi:hypothetical protein